MTATTIARHVCTPPKGFAAKSGPLWICPVCWSEFVFRPVWSRELGRVIDLWVRHYEPPNRSWVPPARRGLEKKRLGGFE